MLRQARTTQSEKLGITKIVGLLGLTLLRSPISSAIDLQSYKFTDSYRYSYLDDSSQEQFIKPFVLTTSFAHIETPLSVTDSRFSQFIAEVIKSYDLLTLGGAYRIAPNFILGIESAMLKTKLKNENETHLGDTHFKAKIRLLSDSGQSFSLLPEVIVPTGSEYSYTTRNTLAIALKLVYEYHSGAFHMLLNTGYAHSPKNKYSIINYSNLLLTELGLSYDVNPAWNINLEVNRNFTFSTDYRQDEGEYYLTLKNKTTNDLSTYFGAGIAGFSNLDKKNWTAFLGLKFNFSTTKANSVINLEKIAPVEKNPLMDIPEQAALKAKINSAKDERKLYGEVFALENIYFENGKTNVSDGEQLKIDQLVTKLSKHIKNINHIVIEGYASKAGISKKNQFLSLKRAREVQLALINSGINEELISVVAYGDRALKQDVDENKNRKVQFRIYLLKDL